MPSGGLSLSDRLQHVTKGSCPCCFAFLCFISSVYVAIKITLSLSINGGDPVHALKYTV